MDSTTDKKAFRSKVRRRLIKALSDLHPDIEVVRVRAWPADDEPVGRRWAADERSEGRGTHDAYLIVVKRPPPELSPPVDSDGKSHGMADGERRS